MKTRLLRAAGMVLGLAAMWSVARAAPLDTRIPADAVVYAGWAGADTLAPAYGASNLKGFVENTTIGAYVQANWDTWMERAARGNADAKEAQEAAVKTGRMLWQHPSAMYVGPMGLADPENPTFKVAFLCDAGAEAPAMLAYYQEKMAKHPARPEAKVQLALDGTVLILTFGEAKPEDFKVNAAGLTSTAGYKGSLGKMRKDPAVALYVDAEKIIGTIEEAVEKAPHAPAEAKKGVPAVLEALGLKGLRQVAVASGFEGKEWADEAFIGTSGPRVGLLSLLEGPPVTDAAIAMVPKDAVAMNVVRFDMVKLLGVTREVLAKVDARALAEFEKVLAEGEKELGVNIEKDLINALGDEWVTYRGPLQDDGSYPFVLVQKLRDAAGFGKVLGVLTERVNAAAEGKVKIEELDAGKFKVTGVRLPAMMAGMPSSVAWTIRDGVFYASTLEGVASAVEQVEGKKESITANAGYKAVRGVLGNGKGTMVSYSEPAKLYPGVYRQIMGLLPLARLGGFDLPGDLLPMPKKVAEFMPPGGGISWTEADGFHFVSRSAFPGAEMMSGQASPAAVVGVTAMGTAVLVPSLARARAQAVTVQGMSRLRQVGIACQMYAVEHKDEMPAHLADLIADEELSDARVLMPAGQKGPEITEETRAAAKKDITALAKEIDERTDIVYVGKGMQTKDVKPSMVVAYEKPSRRNSRGISVLFGDGHVELVAWNRLAEVFKETNESLKSRKLPEVDVEALQKGAGANR
jgi:prepilin-type processing-associated H-X9-DG protein